MLALLHEAFQTVSPNTTASFLYSDIGVDYYARIKSPQGFGWEPQKSHGIRIRTEDLLHRDSQHTVEHLGADLDHLDSWSSISKLIERDTELSRQELPPSAVSRAPLTLELFD